MVNLVLLIGTDLFYRRRGRKISFGEYAVNGVIFDENQERSALNRTVENPGINREYRETNGLPSAIRPYFFRRFWGEPHEGWEFAAL